MKLILIFVINILEYSLNSLLTLGLNRSISSTMPVYGNSSVLHYYFVNILVGSTQMKQSLIIDTGSSLIGFPCLNFCKNCGIHSNPYYNHKG